jgi:hypothetical protein
LRIVGVDSGAVREDARRGDRVEYFLLGIDDGSVEFGSAVSRQQSQFL